MPLCILLVLHARFYVHEYGLLLLVAVVFKPQVPLYDDLSFFLWHASLRRPTGTTPLPIGEPCVYLPYIPFCTSDTACFPAARLSPRSGLRGNQGGRVYTLRKLWPRPVSVPRGLGFLSGAIGQVITRSLSAKPEPRGTM